MNAVYSGLFSGAASTAGYYGAGFNSGSWGALFNHFSVGGAFKYGGIFAANTALSHVMPSFDRPIGGFGFGISISPVSMLTSGVASSAGGGFRFGAGLSAHQQIGDWTLSAGLSGGKSIGNIFGGVSYDDGKQGISYYHTAYLSGDKQRTGTFGARSGDFSLRWENDVIGDNKDRFRSNATELGYKNYIIGTNVYTTDPGGYSDEAKTWELNGSRIFNNRNGTYNEGYQLSSPLYMGVRSKYGIQRVGYNHPSFGDFFQNGFHHLKIPFIVWGLNAMGSGNFQLGDYNSPYFQTGRYLPYSMY